MATPLYNTLTNYHIIMVWSPHTFLLTYPSTPTFLHSYKTLWYRETSWSVYYFGVWSHRWFVQLRYCASLHHRMAIRRYCCTDWWHVVIPFVYHIAAVLQQSNPTPFICFSQVAWPFSMSSCTSPWLYFASSMLFWLCGVQWSAIALPERCILLRSYRTVAVGEWVFICI